MAERSPIDRETIAANIHAVSHEDHFMTLLSREASEEFRWFISSPGMLASDIPSYHDEIVWSDERFATQDRLRGSHQTLNARTLIATQILVLPRDMSEAGMTRFFEDLEQDRGVSRRLAMIGLNEPGVPIFQPIRTDLTTYIELGNTPHGVPLAAEGVELYLNDPSKFRANTATLEEEIKAAYAHLDEHREEREKKLLKAVERMTRGPWWRK